MGEHVCTVYLQIPSNIAMGKEWSFSDSGSCKDGENEAQDARQSAVLHHHARWRHHVIRCVWASYRGCQRWGKMVAAVNYLLSKRPCFSQFFLPALYLRSFKFVIWNIIYFQITQLFCSYSQCPDFASSVFREFWRKLSLCE